MTAAEVTRSIVLLAAGWRTVRLLIATAICLWAVSYGQKTLAQAVGVTLTLDTNRIEVGQTTTLKVFAQVVPEKRTSAERIFSWYLDLLNSSPAVAQADFSRLQKLASDNDPALSSVGTSSGSSRLGIYDTFLNRAGAGVSAPVLLFSVPVIGVAAGKNTFTVRAGTGVSALDNDFLVAPLGGGDPLVGGNYLAALAQLQVTSSSNALPPFRLTLTRVLPANLDRWQMDYPTVSGWNYYLQWRSSLNATSPWQNTPGGPFNTGRITLTNHAAGSFYRVQAQRSQ